MPEPTTGPRLVPGTLVVALLLATGRWGSYLGWPSHQLYVTDLGLVLTVGWVALRHRDRVLAGRRRLLALLPVVVLVLVACIRLAVGSDHSMTALRDFVPYAYAATAALALVEVGSNAVRNTLRVLVGALLLHLLWVTASVADRGLPWRLPQLGQRVHIFELRQDYDAAALGLLAALALHHLLGRRSLRHRLAALLVGLWATVVVLQLANRAGLLAEVVAGALVLAADLGVLRRIPLRYSVAGTAGLAVVAAVVVPRTQLYERLTGSKQFGQNTAKGTESARIDAWRAILRFVDDRTSRVLTGVGFGPNFLEQAGIAYIFVGTSYTDVRAPHDYLINTYARMGLVGLLAAVAVLLAGALAAVRCLRLDPEARERYLPLVLLCASILVISLVGVDLESPFGAVPFFWALGQLLVGQPRAGQVTGRKALGDGRTSGGNLAEVPAVGRVDALAQRDLGLPAE